MGLRRLLQYPCGSGAATAEQIALLHVHTWHTAAATAVEQQRQALRRKGRTPENTLMRHYLVIQTRDSASDSASNLPMFTAYLA